MIKPGRYKHIKGGMYIVICTAIDDSTKDLVVVYMNETHGTYYTRPFVDFTAKIDGIPRFELVDKT